MLLKTDENNFAGDILAQTWEENKKNVVLLQDIR